MEGEKYISEFLPALKKLGYDFTDPSRETSKKEKYCKKAEFSYPGCEDLITFIFWLSILGDLIQCKTI